MGSSGGGVGVTRTPEDTKVIVTRRGTEEGVVGSESWRSSRRKAVEKVGGSVEALSPEASRKRGLEQKGAHDIVSGPNHALSLAVLWGGVRTRHAKLDTAGEEERAGGMVIKLTPVVTLDSLNGEAELSRHPGKEVEKGRKRLRLSTQWESPRVMGEVINHHKIVFETRNAWYRRGPQITMYKIEGMRGM